MAGEVLTIDTSALEEKQLSNNKFLPFMYKSTKRLKVFEKKITTNSLYLQMSKCS